MNNIEYIINLCFDIADQGKIPSVALIRNMSQQPLAIPEVVKGIQRWKSNSVSRPRLANKPINTISATDQSLHQRVTQLEEQVAMIMQKLAEIKEHK